MPRFLAWIWTAPNTLLGLIAGFVLLAGGARVRAVQGAIEFGGGAIGRALVDRTPPFRFRAMTLGHVILGASEADLDAARAHEHVHVRQYERWGPLFLPAYLLSSIWQLVTGRRLYRDNHFERQAFDHGPHPGRSSGDLPLK